MSIDLDSNKSFHHNAARGLHVQEEGSNKSGGPCPAQVPAFILLSNSCGPGTVSDLAGYLLG